MAGTYIGVWKQAAKRAGLTLDDYLAKKDAGERWCSGCKALHHETAFGQDMSRHGARATICTEFRNRRARARYVHRSPRRRGWLVPARDGDKLQARRRVNYLVESGQLAHPNERPCNDCGHTGDDRRHEYDHLHGYGAEHQLDVEPVCSRCHSRREQTRRKLHEFPR